MIKARDPKVNLKVALWKAQRLIDYLEESQVVDLPQLQSAYSELAQLLREDEQNEAAEEADCNAQAIKDLQEEGGADEGAKDAIDPLGNPIDPTTAQVMMDVPVNSVGSGINFEQRYEQNRPHSHSSSRGDSRSMSRGASRRGTAGGIDSIEEDSEASFKRDAQQKQKDVIIASSANVAEEELIAIAYAEKQAQPWINALAEENKGIRKKVVQEIKEESQRVQSRVVSILEEKLKSTRNILPSARMDFWYEDYHDKTLSIINENKSQSKQVLRTQVEMEKNQWTRVAQEELDSANKTGTGSGISSSAAVLVDVLVRI